jgi:hypothetical protein
VRPAPKSVQKTATTTQIPPDDPSVRVEPDGAAESAPAVDAVDQAPEAVDIAEWVRWYIARPGGKRYPWTREKIEEALALCTPKATWRQLHVYARCRVEVDEITGRKRRVLREDPSRLVAGRLDGRWSYGAEHHWRALANRRRCASCNKRVGQDWLRNGRCNACDLKARRSAKKAGRQ